MSRVAGAGDARKSPSLDSLSSLGTSRALAQDTIRTRSTVRCRKRMACHERATVGSESNGGRDREEFEPSQNFAFLSLSETSDPGQDTKKSPRRRCGLMRRATAPWRSRGSLGSATKPPQRQPLGGDRILQDAGTDCRGSRAQSRARDPALPKRTKSRASVVRSGSFELVSPRSEDAESITHLQVPLIYDPTFSDSGGQRDVLPRPWRALWTRTRPSPKAGLHRRSPRVEPPPTPIARS